MSAQSKAIHAKMGEKKMRLGEGSLEERRETAKRANAQMRKKGTFYIGANFGKKI